VIFYIVSYTCIIAKRRLWYNFLLILSLNIHALRKVVDTVRFHNDLCTRRLHAKYVLHRYTLMVDFFDYLLFCRCWFIIYLNKYRFY